MTGKVIEKVISSLEDEQIPVENYLFSFLFIIFIRQFLESFSQVKNKLNYASNIITDEMIHFGLSYLTLAILLIMLLHYATNHSIQRIMRVVLPGFVVLWLNPLIDLIASPKTGVVLLYLQPGFVHNLLYSYFTFFGNFIGASLGLKIEIGLVLIGIYLYLRCKQLSRLLSFFYTWVVYSIIFCWGASPFLIQYVQNTLGFPYAFSGKLMIQFYLITNFFLGLLLFYLWNPTLFRLIVKDIRVLRVLHYELMLVFGVSLALAINSYDIWQQLYFSPEIISNTFFCMVSLLFACLYAIIVNNISDIKIDRISNRNRPLVKKAIDIKTYHQLGYFFLILAWFYAAMVNGKTFLLMTVFIGSYYIYSSLPLRLKRLPLFSKLAISLNSIALILLGYILVNHSLADFPPVLFFIYFMGVTVAANFIDLKDVKGDSAAGIMTLPVILGESTAKVIIGIAFWATYISFFYLIPNYYFLILLIAAGGLQCYLINRKPYRESLVFGFYNLGVLILIFYLLIAKTWNIE